jgi:hypothetical protein
MIHRHKSGTTGRYNEMSSALVLTAGRRDTEEAAKN